MMRLRANFFTVASILFVAFATLIARPMVADAHEAKEIRGVWTTPERDSEIEIYGCGIGKICGRILLLADPLDEDGEPQKDIYNKDESLRSRVVLGLEFITGFTVDEGGHAKLNDGRIYNPRDGKTYKATLTLNEDDTLKVRGFVGASLFGKSEVWTRVRRAQKAE